MIKRLNNNNLELAGVIKLELLENFIDINSLVVHPNFFRLGIAGALLDFASVFSSRAYRKA